MSTPVLAIVLYLFKVGSSPIVPSIVANLVGGLIFFWVDKLIFKPKAVKNTNKDNLNNEGTDEH